MRDLSLWPITVRNLLSLFKHHRAHLVVLLRATTLRLGALCLHKQARISIFSISFSKLKRLDCRAAFTVPLRV